VDVLVVTDHNSIEGSKKVRALAEGNPRFIPCAGEYKTEKGDIIGLFLSKEIRSTQSDEVIHQIREQGGLVVLPHPYKAHNLDEELLNSVDIVETFNSRCSQSENEAARKLAEKLGKAIIGGTDAHCGGELFSAFTNFPVDLPSSEAELRQLLLEAPRTVESRPVSRLYRPCSQIIKAFRTRDPWLFLYQTKRLAATLFREAIG
jgi:predicted metal-dependent phosphoesterase TrpH